MTDTDLINRITTTAMQALNEHGATDALASFHDATNSLAYMLREGFPRRVIQSQCAEVILSAWALALNSSESPNDILTALERRVNGHEE